MQSSAGDACSARRYTPGMDAEPAKDARVEAARRGVGGYERHIFLCTGPDCVTPEGGLAAWDQLKQRVAKLNGSGEGGRVYRTKVGCLRICCDGPVALVYPEGTWYRGAHGAALDRIVAEHLGEGRPVDALVIGENPLPG